MMNITRRGFFKMFGLASAGVAFLPGTARILEKGLLVRAEQRHLPQMDGVIPLFYIKENGFYFVGGSLLGQLQPHEGLAVRGLTFNARGQWVGGSGGGTSHTNGVHIIDHCRSNACMWLEDLRPQARSYQITNNVVDLKEAKPGTPSFAFQQLG